MLGLLYYRRYFAKDYQIKYYISYKFIYQRELLELIIFQLFTLILQHKIYLIVISFSMKTKTFEH